MEGVVLFSILCYALRSGAQDIVAYNEPVIGSTASTLKSEDNTIAEVTSSDPLNHLTKSNETAHATDQRQSSSLTSGHMETENSPTSPYADEQSGTSESTAPTTSERYLDGTSIPEATSKAKSETSVGTPMSDGTKAITTETKKPVPMDRTSAGSTAVRDVNVSDGSGAETMASHGPASDTTSGPDGTASGSHGTHANGISLEGSSNAPTTLADDATRDMTRSSSAVTPTKSRSDGRKTSTTDGAYIKDENATQGSLEVTETTEIEGTRGTTVLDKSNSSRTAATTSLFTGRVKTTYEASNESAPTDSSDSFNETLSSDTWNAATTSPAESPCGKTDGSECSTQEIIDQNVKKCKRIFIISFVISLAILMTYTVFSGLHGMLRKKSKKL